MRSTLTNHKLCAEVTFKNRCKSKNNVLDSKISQIILIRENII